MNKIKWIMIAIVLWLATYSGITVRYFELSLYEHYKMIDVLSIDIGMKTEHSGSLLFIEWHEGDWQFGMFFLNGSKSRR